MARTAVKKGRKKTTQRKKAAERESARTTGRALRRLSDDFEDRRYAPVAGTKDYVWVVLMSVGGIATGIGIYAVMFRDENLPPAPWTNYVLAAGVTLVVAYLLLGRSAQRPVRVGELGIGFEEEGKVSRVAWWQIKSLEVDAGALLVKTKGKTHTLALSDDASAVVRIVEEARERIPDRVELDEDEIKRLPEGAEPGERIAAEPPQIAGMECRSSSQALTFEKDVRLCGRCGVPYHKTGVPKRCAECGRRLKRS